MPSTYSAVPLMGTGDWITAGWVNTYIGGNAAAMWAGQAAGDMDYYLSASEKGRLALTAGGVLYGGASAPAWLAPGLAGRILTMVAGVPAWRGLIHAKGQAHVAPAQDSVGSDWNDINGTDFNLTLTATCTVVVLISAQIATGDNRYDALVRGSVAGGGGAESGTYATGYTSVVALDYWVSQGAGTWTVKAQFRGWAAAAHVNRCSLLAFAFAE